MASLCQNCCDPLPTSMKNPNQRFCGKDDCQRARKRQWQRKKMKNDPDYKRNQQEANRNWQKKNPQYWQEYRQKNPEYTERNKENSRYYMQIKRQVESILNKFAKMDAKFLNINVCQEDMKDDVDVYKERTV